jgi:hypothetical protein
MALMRVYTNFQDIPPFTRSSSYHVSVGWEYLEKQIAFAAEGVKSFELNPDFQRGHVWTREQQIAYVEFCLRGGRTGRDVYFNCTGWNQIMDTADSHYVCVDGLQRLTAVRKFMASEIPAFGTLRKDYTGVLRMHQVFNWHVNDLATRAEVLQWYLEFNTGGTIHSDEELDRVRQLLAKERSVK